MRYVAVLENDCVPVQRLGHAALHSPAPASGLLLFPMGNSLLGTELVFLLSAQHQEQNGP